MEIQRDILLDLEAWKVRSNRKPLVMQGARQVGKSWVLKKFGASNFEHTAYFNFDTTPSLKQEFQMTRQPQQLIRRLEMILAQPILPERTLIIFDEIQECNEALNALKYFCEEMPQYAIVCAGSLLGVALNRSGASFPVGKVQFCNLYPLSFREFLRAENEALFRSYEMIDGTMSVPEVIHQQLIEAYRCYLALGGMPEAVSDFMDNHNWDEVREIQQNILNAYTLDFAKHINNKDIPRVFQVWQSLQDQLAREDRKFRYADIQRGARAREYEASIQWLQLAGLVHQLHAVETPRLPLSAYQNSSAFKIYLNDVGLLCRKFNLSPQAAVNSHRLFTEFKGVLSENYILISLVRQFGQIPVYWTSGNQAEVEFLLQVDNQIIPIEVKSEENVKAKSLSMYRKKYAPTLSLRFSTRNLRRDDDLLNLPLYLVDKLKSTILPVALV